MTHSPSPHSPSPHSPSPAERGQHSPSRRTVLTGAALAVPALALPVLAPESAAASVAAGPAPAALSPGASRPGARRRRGAADLALALLDPPVNGERSTPIHWGSTGRVAQRGALPPGLRITNAGKETVSSAHGLIEVQMQNAFGAGHHLAYRLRIRSPRGEFSLLDTTPGIPATNASRTYRWTLSRTLKPGESTVIPFEYYTPKTFTNPDFAVLVMARVEDSARGVGNDVTARLGSVPGYSSTVFSP